MQLRFEVILRCNVGNENSDTGHIKCSCGPLLARVPHGPCPWRRDIHKCQGKIYCRKLQHKFPKTLIYSLGIVAFFVWIEELFPSQPTLHVICSSTPLQSLFSPFVIFTKAPFVPCRWISDVLSRGVRKGVGVKTTPLSLKVYKNVITRAKDVNCFHILFAMPLNETPNENFLRTPLVLSDARHWDLSNNYILTHETVKTYAQVEC